MTRRTRVWAWVKQWDRAMLDGFCTFDLPGQTYDPRLRRMLEDMRDPGYDARMVEGDLAVVHQDLIAALATIREQDRKAATSATRPGSQQGGRE